MSEELKKIKKLYGENFAKLCRELFPTISEQEGLLFEIMLARFEPSRSLYADIIKQGKKHEFKNFIYSLAIKDEVKIEKPDIKQTPEELFDKAGYNLFKCETDKDVKKFKKYYTLKEELCTFNDSNRIKTHTIFFAVKKDVEKIKRENFLRPSRQDEYGTSVISLQFSKVDNYLSIKNRYNHSVANCDATFSNDLDNITPGLTDSFDKYYGLAYHNKSGEFELDNYVCDRSGKYYCYNHEINNIYYCPNNTLIEDGKVYKLDKSRYEVIDYFILDKKEAKIKCLGRDAFVDEFEDVKKIDIIKNKATNKRLFNVYKNDGNEFSFAVDEKNQIVEYYNYYLENIKDLFLQFNETCEVFMTPNVKKVGNDCLEYNKNLSILDFKNVEEIGNSFARNNKKLTSLILQNVKTIGDDCLFDNNVLQTLILPNIEQIGDWFLADNQTLRTLTLNAKKIGNNFMYFNYTLKKLNLPNLISMGKKSLYCNKNSDTFRYEIENKLVGKERLAFQEGYLSDLWMEN